jgi:hypothetical protein
MKFFTNGTWSPRTPQIEQVATPVGDACLACGKTIGADDCGVLMIHADARMADAVSGDGYRPWHLSCFRRALGIEGADA